MKENMDLIRNSILRKRFDIWRNLLNDLGKSAVPEHSVVRFPNSSSYIFSTGSRSFWMMDPVFSRGDEPAEELRRIAALVREKIAFVILSHLHGDHCQFALLKLLADAPVQWIVPQECAAPFLLNSGIPAEKILALADDDSTELCGIRITARHGFHADPDKERQIPAAAYEVVLPDGVRLNFPGDVRDFHLPQPTTGVFDYTFGHVFLGREDATGENFSQLGDFCSFMTHRKSRHLFLTHLYEIGRKPRDMWTARHAQMVRERLMQLEPELQVIVPEFGDTVHLECGKNLEKGQKDFSCC